MSPLTFTNSKTVLSVHTKEINHICAIVNK